MPDLSNYYTKTQVNKLLNDKANISDVDSKVDDEEVKDVIKDIQFNTSNPNGITMVMFKYDGSNDSISLPIASTGSAGIVTSKDFLDFVKQHQLQELHTEMIDTFADVRAKYQKKLIAGLNIEIDQETNVISASGVDPTTTYVKKAGDTMTGSLFIETTSEINLYNTISVPSSRYAVLRLKSGDNYWDVTTKGTDGLLLQKQGASDVQLKLDTSGNVSIPGYFKSTVATGTAPIQVSSTTLCTNLNADMVDGVNVKDIEHTLYIQSTTKNYLKIQVNHKYFPNSYKIVEYYDGYIYVYQLLINAYSPEFTDLQLISGKVHTGIKTFYDLTKWYIETTESGMNIYIYQPENSNFKIYGVIHGEPESPNVQFSAVSSLPSNVVSRHITFNVTSQNLEEFDWYGVSWSETSSNPDCTRIGNMDMHRTLPIQSMMKGYKVTTKYGNLPYMLRKLEDDWSKTIGGYYGSTYDNNFSGNDTNIMVLIPEFWWILVLI